MQDQRGTLDEGHVPGQRHPADDDDSRADDVAVGTAHTDHETGSDHDGSHDGSDGVQESYPAGTYASGSVAADSDHDGLTDRDDVEVVDHDRALADEQAVDADADRDETARDETVYGETARDETVYGETAHDETVRDETDDPDTVHDVTADDSTGAEREADEVEAREEAEARGDDDFVPADVDPPADERDEVETAAAEEADDRAWAADHATELRAGSVDEDRSPAEPYEGAVGDDTAEDRAWAAEHATQLRAGSLTDAGTDVDDHDATPVDGETVATSEALEGGEALDAGDVVAVPVPDSTAGQDLRPGAVEAVPVGAVWAEGAADGLRERWRELQLRFIDDPRSVAGEADQLITEAVSTVTAALESQRAQLSAWQGEGGDDTERLRSAVRQYRDFLDRLLGL